ncbi:hypothetical protein FPHYL_361 [Fusarium phyllophilum]|uniref:Uncharacterized protein n=1 Tax=Fusarium phyllophilum TaxID=47803 RepID=A0A8H5NN18_9HYPO|nr:hypothetical protein FPHYL_361 [Fusarium phyllophilum]
MSDHSLPDAPQSPDNLIYDPDRLDWEDLIQNDNGDDERHICLQGQCDLCLFDMTPDDLAIAFGRQQHRISEPTYCRIVGNAAAGSAAPTLVQDIKSISPDSEVWAYLAIEDRAEEISSAAGQDDLSCMLDKVESWTRGEGAPVMSDSTAGDWGIRITTDRWGIRKIERIVGIPSYADWRSESLAFALIPLDTAVRSSVDFRLGAARIQLWNGKSVMWDTPSPPLGGRLSIFAPCHDERLSNMRLRTLDLRSTRGLTFFYVGSSLRAIHSHTPLFPTALTTYARLPEHDRTHVAWAYVPIAPNDRLIGLGIRTSGMDDVFPSPCILIRTKLAGDIVLVKDHTCDIIPELYTSIPFYNIINNNPQLELYSAPNPGTSPGDHPD